MKFGENRTWILLFCALGVCGSIILCFCDPNDANSILPGCIFYKCTSLYCPGCGATRALHALVHGDIKEALSQNMLLFLMVPLLAAMAIYPKIVKFRFFAHIVLAVVVLFAVLRNLECFSFLAPH